MADLTAIRNALGAQITEYTGLRTDPQARDSVAPPVGVILPGSPYIRYGDTMDGALSINLIVLLIITDAAPVEKTQRALDSYLGIGASDTTLAESVPAAVLADVTLSGTVHWCESLTVTNYGRIDYSGVTYFGARLNLTLGAI